MLKLRRATSRSRLTETIYLFHIWRTINWAFNALQETDWASFFFFWGGGGRGGVKPRGVLPYMGYIGMCGAKGYGFSAVLVINRVLLLAILVINRV